MGEVGAQQFIIQEALLAATVERAEGVDFVSFTQEMHDLSLTVGHVHILMGQRHMYQPPVPIHG